ncbi:MAG TPA: hypothetical protein PKY63_03610, partial [Bacteroidales bacterium]|nr:hypothetical protein [Bacteroidales bacterium]
MKKLLLAAVAALLLHAPSFALLVTPSMVAPSHGSVGQTVNVLLDWGTSTGATYYQYKLSTSPTLAGATANSTGSNSYFYTSELKFNTTYYWSVRARSATDSSDWSVIYMFTTMDGVSLVSPSNGATGQDVNPYLDWSIVDGITYYDVEIDTTASFSSPLHQLVSQSSSYSYYYPANLRFGQKYYWRMRARHNVDTTTWSTTWNFTTMDNVYLVAPSNGATGQDVNPYLDWGVVNGITYYDVEL